jgi:predicted Zn-dependent protease
MTSAGRNLPYRPIWLHRGEPAAARAFLTQALTHHPLETLTHVNLGLALFEQGEITSAEAQYAAALSREPDFFSAHHGLATQYESTGDQQRATVGRPI